MLCTTTVQEVQSSSYHPHMSFLRRTRYQAGDEPIWREVADWTFQNKNALSALPHVKRSGYFSMNEGGKRVHGVYLGVDTFSGTVRNQLREKVQALYGKEIRVDFHFVRPALRHRGQSKGQSLG